jgi:outer membrane protein assembly factor BamB
MVFVADRSGAVRAFDGSGKPAWTAYTGGAIYYPPAIAMDRLFVGSADGRVYAFEARTGRFLWSYCVAPYERRIPVYGRLISVWPVAGGVAVKDGTVYAAAGITHYDGTYVVALDAVTGAVEAQNVSSGVLAAEVNNGVSLQGNLGIVDNELRFLGGGIYETARYDLATLKCLNQPKVQVTSQFHTAFYPYYPAYGKYVSLDYTLPDGRFLEHDASYEGSLFRDLNLREPRPPGVKAPWKPASRWYHGQRVRLSKTVWRDKARRRFTCFVVGKERLLTVGHPGNQMGQAALTAIGIADGADVWTQKLPALAVKGGAAIDSKGRIYVSLENGKLLCFEPDATDR